MDAVEGDTGNYKCIAKNIAGSSEKEVQLSVLTPPVIKGKFFNNFIPKF